MNRAAMYAWGGPGTIRLLKTKYFSPTINDESFLTLYDKSFLTNAKKIFGVTDMFITFSWGFSDATEGEDKQFILNRLSNFKKLNIKTYAYVQGFNLVYTDFPDKDLWCKSPIGRRLLYSKGRAFTCPNNPEAFSILKQRAIEACSHPFDAVYVDNILFGLPPIYVYRDETSFFGCSCRFCQEKFKKEFGYNLPLGRKRGEQVIADYLSLRRVSIKERIQELSAIVRSAGKQFGINLYDPCWHAAPYYFGYDLPDIEPYLDYFVIENHALKKSTIDNRHLIPQLIKSNSIKATSLTKPTFVISYRNGIGHDSAYSQQDMDLIHSESRQLGYIPCYKATEFKTQNVWHALYLQGYREPVKISFNLSKPIETSKTLVKISGLKTFLYSILSTFYERFSTSIPEQRIFSYLFLESFLFTGAIRKRQVFDNH